MDKETIRFIDKATDRREQIKINWIAIVGTIAIMFLCYLILKITGVLGLFGV